MEPKKQNPKLTQIKKQQILPEHNFYRYFGFIIVDVFTFFRCKIKWFQKTELFLQDSSLPAHFDKTNEKIEKYIPIWKTLKTYYEGEICYHVYKMFYSIMRDPEFYNLSKYDQNILLWAVLLHDISKRGYPEVDGKDPLHPFQSAWQTLHYFNETFKFIKLTSKDLSEWDDIFKKASIKKDQYTMCQNHEIVPKVKTFLERNLKDKHFEKELIYYILLHQSFPALDRFPHASLLEPIKKEFPKYFNRRTFNLFRIFLRHDSFSYIIYSSKAKKVYGEEMDSKIRLIQAYIKE